MDVRVDEAGCHDPAAGVDLASAAIAVERADDPVAADRDIAIVQRAGGDVEDAGVADHEIGCVTCQHPG